MSALAKVIRSLRFLILVFFPIKAITRIDSLALLHFSEYNCVA